MWSGFIHNQAEVCQGFVDGKTAPEKFTQLPLTITSYVTSTVKTRILTVIQFSSVQSLSCVQLFATPWTTARHASLSITNSWSLPKHEPSPFAARMGVPQKPGPLGQPGPRLTAPGAGPDQSSHLLERGLRSREGAEWGWAHLSVLASPLHPSRRGPRTPPPQGRAYISRAAFQGTRQGLPLL